MILDHPLEEQKVHPMLELHKDVRAPSVMHMSCNLLEVVRLREEIILRMHEC